MSKRRLHNWLPEDDEANIFGFWVPTPDQIQEQAHRIRSGEIQLVTDGKRNRLNHRHFFGRRRGKRKSDG